jgi:hypothetical protein
LSLSDDNRRAFPRLFMNLPITFHVVEHPDAAGTGHTLNVSRGGVYFEYDGEDVQPGTVIDLEMAVPPGSGHFSYASKVISSAEVLRVVDYGHNHRGIAGRFLSQLKMEIS